MTGQIWESTQSNNWNSPRNPVPKLSSRASGSRNFHWRLHLRSLTAAAGQGTGMTGRHLTLRRSAGAEAHCSQVDVIQISKVPCTTWSFVFLSASGHSTGRHPGVSLRSLSGVTRKCEYCIDNRCWGTPSYRLNIRRHQLRCRVSGIGFSAACGCSFNRYSSCCRCVSKSASTCA